MKKLAWGKFGFEFLSIFIAVISAFALNNWNDNRREANAEAKILGEIANGLVKDIDDVNLNVSGHEAGLRACAFWTAVVSGREAPLDSLSMQYFNLTRDFVSIQNVSGYETLKSRGLELIGSDSLRLKIITLYEYHYNTLRKLEEEYHEIQFQENYFQEINKAVAPAFTFDERGDIKGMRLPLELTEAERRVLLSYLWKIRANRHFMLFYYTEVRQRISELQEMIRQELES